MCLIEISNGEQINIEPRQMTPRLSDQITISSVPASGAQLMGPEKQWDLSCGKKGSIRALHRQAAKRRIRRDFI